MAGGAAVELVETPRALSAAAFRTLAIASVLFSVGVSLGLALHGRQVDIDVYLLGGAHFSSADLYSLQVDKLLFTYPPFAAIVFAPLAHLVRTAAQIVWGLANIAALFWLIDVSIRSARPELPSATVRRWSVLCLAPALLLNPVLETTYLGQVNTVLAAMVVTDLGYGCRWLPKGMLTGIAAAVKLTPLIFIPYLFLTRQYRAGCVALATFTACGVTGYFVSPKASMAYWTKDVFDSQRAGGLLSISNQNLNSALMRIVHGSVHAELLAPLILGLGVLGLALAAWAYWSSSSLLGVLVCATTGLVISPITWSHHLVWVVPAIAWLALAPDGPTNGLRWAIAMAVFFWAGPIWWVPLSDRGLHEKDWELVVGDSFLWVMLSSMLAVAVRLTRRQLQALRPLDRVAPREPAEMTAGP